MNIEPSEVESILLMLLDSCSSDRCIGGCCGNIFWFRFISNVLCELLEMERFVKLSTDESI